MEEDKPKEEPKSIAEQLNDIKGLLKEEKEAKKKKFRLPWRARVGKAKVKKNWIGVWRLNENRTITPFKTKIEEGVFEDKEGSPFLGMSEYVWYWKNKPIIITPSWSFEPIGSKRLTEDAVRLQTLNVGRKLLKNHLERGQMETAKKKFGMGPIIIIGVLAVIGYFIYKSGAFGG